MKTRRDWILLGLALLLSFSSGWAADLTVQGINGKAIEQSVDQLKQMPSATQVEYTARGQKHQAQGVPLLAVLEAAGLDATIVPSPNVSPTAKHPPLRMAVSVRGGDGYGVVFSVAELLPSVGKHPAWLVWDVDGQPITGDQGPLKLLTPDDAGPARAVRHVVEVKIADLSFATAPASTP